VIWYDMVWNEPKRNEMIWKAMKWKPIKWIKERWHGLVYQMLQDHRQLNKEGRYRSRIIGISQKDGSFASDQSNQSSWLVVLIWSEGSIFLRNKLISCFDLIRRINLFAKCIFNGRRQQSTKSHISISLV
jgi:hypothetical protein